MKKALLSMAALGLLSTQGFGQINLADTSFNDPIGTSDSVRYVVDGYNSNITNPNQGNEVNNPHINYTWDLINNNYVSGTGIHPRGKKITYTSEMGYDYGFNTYDTVNHRVGNTTAPFFTYPVVYLHSLVANSGLLEYGRKISPIGYNISSLPGANPLDSIKLYAQTSKYYSTIVNSQPTDRKILGSFPTTMGDSWNNLYQDTVKATITYGSMYTNDTIWIKETVSELSSVVGWGKMRINVPSNLVITPTNSIYFNVLQVKTDYQVVDSFYIDGIAAPTTLLTSLGVTQGQVRRSYHYDFYRPDYVIPFAHIQHTDASRTTLMLNKHAIHPEHWNPTSVNKFLAEAGFSVYPNPVNNGKVYVDIKEPGVKSDWSYNIININGQTIAASTLTVNSGKAEVTLPTGMSAGIYYITITDGERKMTKSLSVAE